MTIELGGSITLVGFKERDPAELVVVKKLVGAYARKITDASSGFEGLTVSMKPVHKQGDSEKFEVHAKVLLAGKPQVSEVTDRNLFVALDSALKKLTASLA
ncbi:MAG: hypothetical protein HC945_01740 [Nitrosarchaeum sp.]|nr:hypothetical protein [Nitrosarchaeum sp.]